MPVSSSRDANRVPAIGGESTGGGFISPYVDSITKRLYVNSQTTLDTSGDYAIKTTEVGDVTYLAKAAIGSSQASAVWQAKKIDETTGVIITWADANNTFDNVATDLTTLSYS